MIFKKEIETTLLIQKLQRDINALLLKNGELNDKIFKLEENLKLLNKNYNGLNKKHKKLLKNYEKLTEENKELTNVKMWGKYYGII